MLGTIKRAFGMGAPSKVDRRLAPDLEKLGRDNVPDGALASIWDLHHSRMPNTPNRIRDSRALEAGEKRAPMPKNFSMEDREAFRADGSDKYERPRHTARRLARKSAVIKRPDAGISPAAKKISSRIEQFSNGLLDELFPDFQVVDLLLNEGECAIYMLPMPAHYEKVITLYDMDGDKEPNLGQDEYDALPSAKRKQYEQRPNGQYMAIRKKYRRNADGEPDTGSPDFEVDLSKTADAFQKRLDDVYAKNIPVHLEVLSRLDFIPINPRFSGKRVRIDGIIIRKLFRKSQLLAKGYRWEGCHEQLEPVDPYDGNADGEFYLYILLKYGLDQSAELYYQVGTHGTQFEDGTSAYVNLTEEYGLDELPVSFEYGLHSAASNPDQRSRPFSKSFMANWLNRDAILTGLNVATWLCGFPTWGQKIDKNSLPQAISGDVQLAWEYEPLSVKPLFGDVVDMTAKGPNQGVEILLAAYRELNEDLPAQGAFGGDGPTSGLDRQVQGKDLEVSFGDVIEAYRRLKEASGRFGLMICDRLGEMHNLPVKLHVASPSPVAQSGTQSSTRQIVDLPPGICADTFDVLAEFPHLPGENLANTSLLVTLAEKELILVEEFRELWGDPHPEIFAAKLRLQRYFNSDAGQMDLLEGMAEYLADQKLKQKLQLQAQGRATPGGNSQALMGDLTSGGAGAGGGAAVTGMTLPNQGESALAGGNAGALNADAQSMGSPIAGASAGTGVVA